MEKDTLRMQFLSGVITESEYKVKLQENAADVFDVVTMDEKTMVGTHQEGVGFKANKKGIEMGFKDDPKSIPNKTKMVKNKSLNESMIGGIVGIGAINQIPPRAKADYETAFEHFLGGKYGLNEVEEINENMYYHVLEDGGNGNIGHQGVYDTQEEAQNRADELTDMFPNSEFYVEASDSEDEPYSVTSSDYDPDMDFNEGKEVEEPTNY